MSPDTRAWLIHPMVNTPRREITWNRLTELLLWIIPPLFRLADHWLLLKESAFHRQQSLCYRRKATSSQAQIIFVVCPTIAWTRRSPPM
jgi:hypothetical protein